MVEWCPKCHAMLPPGQDRCPACGERLRKTGDTGFSNRDIFWYSLVFLGIALIPILIAIAIGIICVWVGGSR